MKHNYQTKPVPVMAMQWKGEGHDAVTEAASFLSHTGGMYEFRVRWQEVHVRQGFGAWIVATPGCWITWNGRDLETWTEPAFNEYFEVIK